MELTVSAGFCSWCPPPYPISSDFKLQSKACWLVPVTPQPTHLSLQRRVEAWHAHGYLGWTLTKGASGDGLISTCVLWSGDNQVPWAPLSYVISSSTSRDGGGGWSIWSQQKHDHVQSHNRLSWLILWGELPPSIYITRYLCLAY